MYKTKNLYLISQQKAKKRNELITFLGMIPLVIGLAYAMANAF